MRRYHQTDALPLGCKSRRTEQLLGRTDSKSPTESGKSGISAYFRADTVANADFRRNLPECGDFRHFPAAYTTTNFVFPASCGGLW
jgi:hypothetical protein